MHRAKSKRCQARWNRQLKALSQMRRHTAPPIHNVDNVDDTGMDFEAGNAEEGSDSSTADGSPPVNFDDPTPEIEMDDQVFDAHTAELLQDADKDDNNSGDETVASVPDEFYPGAASVLDKVSPPYSNLYDEQMRLGKKNLYHPFAGVLDWEIASWIHCAGLSKACIDELLRLKICKYFSLFPESTANVMLVSGPTTLVHKWYRTGRAS